VCEKVNSLLASGSSYAMIVRALGEDTHRATPRDRVTIDSVRNHSVRHFPVQSVAHTTYRDILERRARENSIDFVNGVATALTPLAFFEVLLLKAFRRLVDDDAEVSVETGLRAAEKLQAVLDNRDQGDDILQMRLQGLPDPIRGESRGAARNVVPDRRHGGRAQAASSGARRRGRGFRRQRGAYDPIEFAGEHDEF